eukprot:TRINITY_DN3801_c0_g1_i1.p1 TRINITY_DN3801_c0_g1~~TRINITY_DN3801_c0_g1_i1.p1  ORF type:complete len:121 (-),score=1.59 TRINITY_DN3801_c0_g1_i1:1354-1716(-)
MMKANGDYRCRLLPALGLYVLCSVDDLPAAIGPWPVRALSWWLTVWARMVIQWSLPLGCCHCTLQFEPHSALILHPGVGLRPPPAVAASVWGSPGACVWTSPRSGGSCWGGQCLHLSVMR